MAYQILTLFSFVTVQGTGIVNTLLFDLPWKSTHAAFRGIGAGFLVFDMLLFVVFAIITVARYILYPRIFLVMIQHETHSLFLGTIPMGLVTIISGIARTGEEYGLATLDASIVLWWIALGEDPESAPFVQADLVGNSTLQLLAFSQRLLFHVSRP